MGEIARNERRLNRAGQRCPGARGTEAIRSESKRHFQASLKELMLALRSLADACIEHLEKKMGGEGEKVKGAQPSSEEREQE